MELSKSFRLFAANHPDFSSLSLAELEATLDRDFRGLAWYEREYILRSAAYASGGGGCRARGPGRAGDRTVWVNNILRTSHPGGGSRRNPLI